MLAPAAACHKNFHRISGSIQNAKCKLKNAKDVRFSKGTILNLPCVMNFQSLQFAARLLSVTAVVRKRNRGVGLAGRRGIEVGDRLVLCQGWLYVCLFGSRAMAARNRGARNAVFSQRLAHGDGAGISFYLTAG